MSRDLRKYEGYKGCSSFHLSTEFFIYLFLYVQLSKPPPWAPFSCSFFPPTLGPLLICFPLPSSSPLFSSLLLLLFSQSSSPQIPFLFGSCLLSIPYRTDYFDFEILNNTTWGGSELGVKWFKTGSCWVIIKWVSEEAPLLRIVMEGGWKDQSQEIYIHASFMQYHHSLPLWHSTGTLLDFS